MSIKQELFSFRGVVVTVLHNLFILGAVGAMGLSVWIWTGELPIRALKSESGYISDERAISALVDNNPGYDVKLIPQKGGR